MGMADILYIDSRAQQRSAMLEKLKDLGYEALGASNGQEGLAAALHYRPELVVCHSDLTEMTGLELIRKLRNTANGNETGAIILLSDKTDPQAHLNHIEQGADQSLPASIDFEHLRTLVDAQLRAALRQKQRRERELVKLYTSLSVMQDDTSQKNPAPGTKHALADTEAFARIACERLASTGTKGGGSKLTLIEMSGLSALQLDTANPAAGKLLEDISNLLCAKSDGGDAAGILGDDKFGVVHGDDVQREELEQSISDMIHDSGLHEQGLKATTANVSLATDGLSSQEAARALVYAINRFAGQGAEGFTISNLNDGIAGLVAETVERITELRGNINGKRVMLHFQPILELQNRVTHHYEALARFPGGDSPFAAISFAEQVGMVEDFDLSICQQVIDFIRENNDGPSISRIAMNVSAQSIESPVFVSVMRKMMSELGSARKRVLLEITESVRIKNYENVANLVRQLRQDGHHICLDDFGAGESNFNYLRAFEVDFVKIDGIYVRDVLRSSRDQAFIKAITRLCKEINVQTVAEFVEDEKQAVTLRNLGVDFGQGYLFGKPSPELLINDH